MPAETPPHSSDPSDPSHASASSGSAANDKHPVKTLIGGPRGALESILPPVVFVAVYSALSSSNEDALTYAIVAALILAVFFGGWRLLERKRPTRVIGAIVVVALGAYFAARTGSAAAFFWPRVLLNLMRWRQDPVLVRAYSRGSWLWVLLNLVRAAILLPLIANDALWGLAASGAFFYVLVIGTILGSWFIMKRAIPADHPGLRHPVGDPKSTDE